MITETADVVLPADTLERAQEVYDALMIAAKRGTMSGWPELQMNPPAVIIRYGTSAPSDHTVGVRGVDLMPWPEDPFSDPNAGVPAVEMTEAAHDPEHIAQVVALLNGGADE